MSVAFCQGFSENPEDLTLTEFSWGLGSELSLASGFIFVPLHTVYDGNTAISNS